MKIAMTSTADSMKKKSIIWRWKKMKETRTASTVKKIALTTIDGLLSNKGIKNGKIIIITDLTVKKLMMKMLKKETHS